jgi:hypothetical protein
VRFAHRSTPQGWHFGGGSREIIDGYYVTPDGTRTGRVE